MVHHLIFLHVMVITLMTIIGGHMMRILHRMVYNMPLMVMVIQFSTFLWYVSSKKAKEKVKQEHINDDITSFVDESLVKGHLRDRQRSKSENLVSTLSQEINFISFTDGSYRGKIRKR
ncbi:uncharacterized protein [Apostichopus japonicus]|uniref:uncharacterized protein isoform X2 n=1 Tax=Stichopus japonicus TaxID=307972 RepID=UPI003AB4CD8C